MWPTRDRISAPVVASHNFAVLSSEPVRTLDPSGEKAMLQTFPECPTRVAMRTPKRRPTPPPSHPYGPRQGASRPWRQRRTPRYFRLGVAAQGHRRPGVEEGQDIEPPPGRARNAPGSSALEADTSVIPSARKPREGRSTGTPRGKGGPQHPCRPPWRGPKGRCRARRFPSSG